MGVWVRAKRLIEAKPYAAPHSLTHSLTHSSVAVSPLTRLPSPISLTVYRHRARRHRGVVGEEDPTTITITIASGAVVGEVRAWHTQSKTTTTTSAAAAAAAHIIIDNTAHTHTQPHTLTCACPCPLPLLPSLSPACMMCALSLGAYMHACIIQRLCVKYMM